MCVTSEVTGVHWYYFRYTDLLPSYSNPESFYQIKPQLNLYKTRERSKTFWCHMIQIDQSYFIVGNAGGNKKKDVHTTHMSSSVYMRFPALLASKNTS